MIFRPMGWLLAPLLFFFSTELCIAADENKQLTQYSTEELVKIGRQIYRKGILINGEPVEAYVMGDVKVLGTQFTCLNCHGRSGMGGAEGKTFTLAINPDALFNSREDMYLERSEYDDESLENSLRFGITPEGVNLSPAMPLYDLPKLEMKALLTYLHNISSEFSPGLTEQVLHIATVVTDQTDPVAKKAMLDVLAVFFGDKNSTTRLENQRAKRGPYYQHYRLKAYRRWILHVWELSGASDTWEAQLNEYYNNRPVFAMVSGLIPGPWQPVHDFAEKNEIPHILPNTDQPGGLGTDDFYTLYFSEGLHLEARVLAADLANLEKNSRILQIYRTGQKGASAAKSLSQSSKKVKEVTTHDWRLGEDEHFNIAALQEKLTAVKADNLAIWLSPKDIQEINLQEIGEMVPGYTYISSSILGGILSPLPRNLGSRVKLISPYVKPQRQELTFKRISVWLKNNNVKITNPKIHGQSYYACIVLGEGLMHIKRHFFRDYLLDALDHGNAKSIYSVNYPRLSFGPGQRFLGKGAYIIENPHQATELHPAPATWIVPYM